MIYKCKMCKGDLQIIDEEMGSVNVNTAVVDRQFHWKIMREKRNFIIASISIVRIIFLIELMFTILW